jgi:iron complex transport system permease protein
MSLIGQTTVDFGRPVAVLRLWNQRLSQRIDLRTVVVTLLVIALAIAVGLVTLASGDFPVPLHEVIGALLGNATPRVHLVVIEWRLPRTLLALVLGASLGIGGAMFQSLTRNPLGSPDIIGFDAGAYTGALIVIIVFHGSYYEVVSGALLGGIATAMLVYLLAWKRGVQGFRLIVGGIGVAAMLTSLNTWLLLKADLMVAMSAAI